MTLIDCRYEFFFVRKKLILSFIHQLVHCFYCGNVFPKKSKFCELIDKVLNL